MTDHLNRRFYLDVILLLSMLPCMLEASDLDHVKQELIRIQNQYGISALAAIVVDRDTVLLEHYSGVTDWDKPQKVTRETWFRAGSVTKVFTGLAALRAAEKGLVQLDDTVKSQLPENELPWSFGNPYGDVSPLVLADLLEHTAGWYDMSSVEFDDKNPSPLTLTQALQIRPESRMSHWPPGAYYAYSNSGPGLAARVVEHAVGQPFDDWIREQVFETMGMGATLLLEDHIAAGLATGYNDDYRTVIPYWHILYRASGGMNLQPREMERFLRMMLNNGTLDGQEVFTPDQLQRLVTPTRTLAAQHGLAYGYGLGIYSAVRDGHVVYMHGGDADGYLTHFAYSTESGLGYFVVFNAFNHKPHNELKAVLSQFLIEDLEEHAALPDLAFPEALGQRLTGTYVRASIRFPQPGWEEGRLSVRVTDSGLAVSKKEGRWLGLKVTQIESDSVHLRRDKDPVATRAFTLLDDGGIVYQDSSSSWVRK